MPQRFYRGEKISKKISIVDDGGGRYLLRINNANPSNCNNNIFFEANDVVSGEDNVKAKILPLERILDVNTLKLKRVFSNKPLIILEDNKYIYKINIMFCSFTVYTEKHYD